ncbi:MAG: hypothetical protein J6A92_01495 [Lachnospiraceae bacterium]|nr:hypothetical protein [Lachnospiraceae bacterium]
MKSSRMKITAVLMAAAFMFSGCGEELYTLTPEEEAAIVSYAAHTVAKYNTYQQDGEVFVMQEVLDGEGAEVGETEETEVEETEVEATEVAEETEAEATEAAEEETEAEATEAAEEETEAEQTEVAEATEAAVSEEQPLNSGAMITEALDLGVIEAEYVGHSLCTTYDQSEYYTVDAGAGKQLLVLNVNLKNQVNQALHIDILSMAPTFHAIVNGTENVPSQTTILLNDLSTYQADIGANAVNETVLLFQIPQEIQEITQLQLEVTMNGKTFEINL